MLHNRHGDLSRWCVYSVALSQIVRVKAFLSAWGSALCLESSVAAPGEPNTLGTYDARSACRSILPDLLSRVSFNISVRAVQHGPTKFVHPLSLWRQLNLLYGWLSDGPMLTMCRSGRCKWSSNASL